MANKIVFVSHIIRGRLRGPKRCADIASVRKIVRTWEKQYRGIIFTVPYLLYAEATQDIVRARIVLAGWDHNPPDELWLVGPGLCDGMRVEIAHMRQQGLPVVFKTPELGRKAMSAPLACSLAAE